MVIFVKINGIVKLISGNKQAKILPKDTITIAVLFVIFYPLKVELVLKCFSID